MATILPSNFLANTLSGTVSVTNGFANINLPTLPYALEGDKPFVIKLRRGSIQGDVIATSPTITLRDNSAFVSLTANISTVAEGNLVSLSLVTSNAANGSNVFFSIFPVTANVTASDFFGGNTGLLTINNNQATFALYANTDAGYVDETGETFKVQLRTVSPVGNIVYTTANIAITDFYKLYNAIGLVETVSTIAEGSNVTFTFTGHNIPVGTLLYYNTEGNATSSLFTTGNTGSFVMNGLSNTLNLVTTTTVPSQETRNFVLKLRSGSLTGAVVATSNSITVVDSTLAYVNATGGTIVDSGGYRLHAFTTSGNLQISSLGVGAYNNIDYLIVAGGGAGGGGYTAPSYNGGGGGGAGGLLTSTLTLASTGNTVITVGAGGGPGVGGGQGGHVAGPNGGNTTVSFAGSQTLVAIGGGGGGAGWAGGLIPGRSGGSGGGTSPASGSVGAGTPGQGNPGGVASPVSYGGVPVATMAGGGGGAGGAGSWKTGDPESAPTSTHAGGIGLGLSWIPSSYGTPGPNGSLRYFAGGGGGGGSPAGSAYILSGGAGGGGAGGHYPPGYPTSAYGSGAAIASQDSGANAIINTGGGGGGVGSGGVSTGSGVSGRGGSGIVIIRYPYLPPPSYSSVTANSSVVSEGGNLFFVVNTLNANSSILYYDTIGNVTSASFTTGNTGSFVVTGNSTVLRLETASTIPTNEERFFALRIREDSATTGAIRLVSSNVYIYDSSIQPFISATGGNVTTSGSYKIHTFTTSGVLSVSSTGVSSQSLQVMMVGGGAAGAGDYSGGGGAGGVLSGPLSLQSTGNLTVTVGAGGTNGTPAGYVKGGNTTVAVGATTYIALGGGNGGATNTPGEAGLPGGSGGGGGGAPSGWAGGAGGTGIQSPQGTLTGYGNPGGAGIQGGSPGTTTVRGGGGGGAGAAGAPNGGGAGMINTITGSTIGQLSGGQYYVAGGGGGGGNGAGSGGVGGGGTRSTNPTVKDGGVNMGGGGAGSWAAGDGGSLGYGGSGVVVFRYQYT